MRYHVRQQGPRARAIAAPRGNSIESALAIAIVGIIAAVIASIL